MPVLCLTYLNSFMEVFMNRLFLVVVSMVFVLVCTTVNGSAEQYTPEQAIELAKKGAALIQEKGVDEARKILSDTKSGYLSENKEFYVLVMNFKGEWVIYPPFPETEGKSAYEVKDVDGKYLVKDMIKVAQEQGEGWVKYRWVHPPTKKIRPKETYVVRVKDKELFAAVGIYP